MKRKKDSTAVYAVPVSYTHLDVYKRQGEYCQKRPEAFGLFCYAEKRKGANRMKKEKKRNWYEEQKERREREQREKEAREQRRKAAQRRRAEQAGTGNGYAGVEKKTAEPWKSTAGTGKNQTDVAAEGVLPQGKRIRAEAAPTWVNTARCV